MHAELFVSFHQVPPAKLGDGSHQRLEYGLVGVQVAFLQMKVRDVEAHPTFSGRDRRLL